MASNLDTSLESEMLKTESVEVCENLEGLSDKSTGPSVTTKKRKTFLSSLKATPLFSSSPLVSIATNIKNSLHSSRDPRPSKTGGGDLHKSSRSSLKKELVPTCSPVSPVLLRRKSSTSPTHSFKMSSTTISPTHSFKMSSTTISPTHSFKMSSTNSITHSFKMSSTLFDPEEEEPIGPLFGVLRITPSREEMSNRESDISSMASVTSSKAPKGFLERIKCAFGSRLSFGSATSRSTYTDSAVWWSRVGARSLRESPCAGSPELPRRRNSIATFFKRSGSNPSVKNVNDHGLVERRNSLAPFLRSSNPNQFSSRKNSDIVDDKARNSNLSKSLDIARLGPTLRPISINADVDFRDIGLSAERRSLEDKDPQASLSWIWQEMGEKNKNGLEVELESGRSSNDSGDSGIVRSVSKDTNYDGGMSKDANCTCPDQVFGSIPELDDEVFLDIFKTEPKVPSSNFISNEDEYIGSKKEEMTKSVIGTNPVLQYNSLESDQKDFDQVLNSIPMLGSEFSSVRSRVRKELNKQSHISDEKDGNHTEGQICNKIDKKGEKIAIRTNPRAYRTPAGPNNTKNAVDEKDGREECATVRNSIRTNPKIHWTPTKSDKKEQVTSI